MNDILATNQMENNNKKKNKKMMKPVLKMNDILATNQMGKNNKKKNKKIKNISTIPDEIKSLATKEAEAEDLAESVDSGCIPDSSSDIVADVPDIAQIEASVLKENTFISSLLKWMPSDLPGREPEPEVEASRGKKRKNEAKSKQDETRHNNKKQKVDVDLAETHADLDQLQDKYQQTLIDLRKDRNKNLATKKKEAKLSKKLKVLEKRKDKRTKQRTKNPETVEIRKEKNFQQNKLKNVKPVKPQKPQKPIYNQKGQLVFSKFDFSNNNSLSRDMDSNKKSKDLKQILSQTLKEKEKMKQLEKRGDKEGAISLAEQKAWSNALQKAEGKKVKSDVDLLKKSIKKQELRKKTSQKRWEQRVETIEKNKTSKQNLRKKNLSTRKEAKLGRKMKKMQKKGHIVPGF